VEKVEAKEIRFQTREKGKIAKKQEKTLSR
jgi:hypothetical protein